MAVSACLSIARTKRSGETDVKMAPPKSSAHVEPVAETVSGMVALLVVDLATVALLVCACACQISCLVIPGWWHVPPDLSNNFDTRYGLWTIITCVQGTCEEKMVDTSGSNAWLQVTQVFETVAAVACVLTLVLYCLAVFRPHWTLVFKRLCICFIVGAGAAILIGIAVFAKKSAGLARYPPRDFAEGNMAWPMGMTIAAAILCFLSAMMIAVSFKKSKSMADNDPFSGSPLS